MQVHVPRSAVMRKIHTLQSAILRIYIQKGCVQRGLAHGLYISRCCCCQSQWLDGHETQDNTGSMERAVDLAVGHQQQRILFMCPIWMTGCLLVVYEHDVGYWNYRIMEDGNVRPLSCHAWTLNTGQIQYRVVCLRTNNAMFYTWDSYISKTLAPWQSLCNNFNE